MYIIFKSYSKGKGFEPIVKVVADSIFKPCSKVGVDGRADDLIGLLINVQIGWNIPEFGFKPQVRHSRQN